jgi:hypothetical protein
VMSVELARQGIARIFWATKRLARRKPAPKIRHARRFVVRSQKLHSHALPFTSLLTSSHSGICNSSLLALASALCSPSTILTRPRRSSFETLVVVPSRKTPSSGVSRWSSLSRSMNLARFRPSSRNPYKPVSDVQFNHVVSRAQRQQTGHQNQLIIVCQPELIQHRKESQWKQLDC